MIQAVCLWDEIHRNTTFKRPVKKKYVFYVFYVNLTRALRRKRVLMELLTKLILYVSILSFCRGFLGKR